MHLQIIHFYMDFSNTIFTYISFYLSPNGTKQIISFCNTHPEYPILHRYSWKTLDLSITWLPQDSGIGSIDRSVETDITQARKVSDKRIAIPIMRFAFSRQRSPGTFDSHPSARGGFTTSRRTCLPLPPVHTAIGPLPNRPQLILSDLQTVHIAGFTEFRKATDRHVGGQLRSDSVRKV